MYIKFESLSLKDSDCSQPIAVKLLVLRVLDRKSGLDICRRRVGSGLESTFNRRCQYNYQQQ